MYAPGNSNYGNSAFCINRNVTIEAEVPGSVVLDASSRNWGGQRVFLIQSGGKAELIGLSITAERRPCCKKVFGLGENAWFSRFGRPRRAVGHFSRFGAISP